MKRVLIVLIIALMAFQFADAQRKKSSMFDDSRDDRGWNEGDLYIGPVLGYGWGPAIGLDGEYAISDKKWLAFGAGGNIAYHTGYNVGWYTEKAFTVTAYASYHLFPHKKFDVYGKLGLSLWIWSYSYSDPYWKTYGWAEPNNSGFGTIEELGMRYYFTPSIAFRAYVGAPIYLGVGLDFKLM